MLAHILGLPDEDLPRLIELGDRLLVDTDPEYVGELAFAEERPEDRYKPFGSPWAEELCAIGPRRTTPTAARARATTSSRCSPTPRSTGSRCPSGELDNMFALLIVAGNETTRQGSRSARWHSPSTPTSTTSCERSPS